MLLWHIYLLRGFILSILFDCAATMPVCAALNRIAAKLVQSEDCTFVCRQLKEPNHVMHWERALQSLTSHFSLGTVLRCFFRCANCAKFLEQCGQECCFSTVWIYFSILGLLKSENPSFTERTLVPFPHCVSVNVHFNWPICWISCHPGSNGIVSPQCAHVYGPLHLVLLSILCCRCDTQKV